MQAKKGAFFQVLLSKEKTCVVCEKRPIIGQNSDVGTVSDTFVRMCHYWN